MGIKRARVGFALLVSTLILMAGGSTAEFAPAEKEQAAKDEKNKAACSCVDYADIKRRIKEAEIAVDAYRIELKNTSPTVPFNDSTYASVQAHVKAMVNARSPGKPQVLPIPGARGPSRTNWACMVEVTERANPCLQADLLEHEKVHQEACKTRWSKLGSGGRSLRTAIEEEIDAYEAELYFLNSELSRLSQSCWVWTGEISYVNHYKSHSEKTSPLLSGRNADSTAQETRIYDAHNDILVTFRVDETGTVAEVDDSWVQSRDDSAGGKERCRVTGGLKGSFRYADMSYHDYYEKRRTFQGNIKGKITVEIKSDGNYKLSFETVPFPVTVEAKDIHSDGGGCDRAPVKDKLMPGSRKDQEEEDTIRDSVSGVMTPGSDEIVGREDRPDRKIDLRIMIGWKLKRTYRRQ